uniref:Uncharacterized protein n=1 Tax=Cyprinus carpio TaxID=7962 RepID=A0A8C2HD79_CYPCA
MPEGPELHLASLGAVEKSVVNKNPEVPFCCDAYCIKAHSRGKEIRLTLTPFENDGAVIFTITQHHIFGKTIMKFFTFQKCVNQKYFKGTGNYLRAEILFR